MTTGTKIISESPPDVAKLLDQYGCGPIPLAGTGNALYERHLLFDNVIDPSVVTARDRFEALARSVQDILSQRWVLTEKTYQSQNAKRLITSQWSSSLAGRWANNVTNLLLDPLVKKAIEHETVEDHL